MNNIVIAGGTGFIGSHLIKSFHQSGFNVILISRNIQGINSKFPEIDKIYNWSMLVENPDIISESEAIINLSGVSIAAKRWTKGYKKLIIESRISTTKILTDAIKKSSTKPVLINASAIGYYGDCYNNILNESSQNGSDFLAGVCKMWEDKAMEASAFTRVVTPRIGIVLDKSGGALPKFLTQFKFLAGGPLGSGEQWMSWIHMDDLVGMFRFVIDNKNISGPVNFANPNPVQMKELAKTLGKILKKPSFFNVPGFVLRLILGESADLVLFSQRVIPKIALDNQFEFNYTDLKKALNDIINPYLVN